LRFLIFDLRCAALAAAMLLGCDSGEKSAPPAELPQAPTGSGVVRGVVKFAGPPPEMRQIENQGCHTAAEPIFDETIVVNPGGTLKNVIVSIEGLEGGPFDGSGRAEAVLDQVHCAFVPHVVAVQIRQPLRIGSSDPTVHNVHYVPSKNAAGNYSFKDKGASETVRFEKAEIVRMKCDIHPWMTAYVGVFEHPFFAVTGDDGRFEITNLPPGSYKLVAWHELLGKQQQTIEVTDGPAAEVELEYRPPE
jgi:plastocyanin